MGAESGNWRGTIRISLGVILIELMKTGRIITQKSQVLLFSLLLGFPLFLFSTPYDAIFVGMGTANSIVASRFIERHPEKKVLLIEAGQALSSCIGGKEVPSYSKESGLTYVDIPGEQLNNAWSSRGQHYRLPLSLGVFQGRGLGGNSLFNGMCLQIPLKQDFSQWPQGWKRAGLEPFFRKIEKRIQRTSTPSADGRFYLGEAREIFSRQAKLQGLREVESYDLEKEKAPHFGPLIVAAEKGVRSGPSSAYLSQILDEKGHPRSSRVDLWTQTIVKQLIFEGDRVVRVSTDRGEAFLAPEGKVILGAGALHTPRLLFLSGVGPRGREGEIFGEGSSHSFVINNPKIGVSLYDHAATLLVFDYQGEIPYQAYWYGSEEDHQKDLQRYARQRSGPYAQYGPVWLLRGATEGQELCDYEVIVNPFGIGGAQHEYGAPRAISAYVMLLYPQQRDVLRIDEEGNVKKPNLYFGFGHRKEDLQVQKKAVQQFLEMSLAGGDLKLLLGPKSMDDIEAYIQRAELHKGIELGGVVIHHFGGTCPLSEEQGGVDPGDLRVKGTQNVHVVDASLIPFPLGAHPILTIMALAEKIGGLL